MSLDKAIRHRQILRYCRMYGEHIAPHQWLVGNRWYLVGDGVVYWAPVEEKDERSISTET